MRRRSAELAPGSEALARFIVIVAALLLMILVGRDMVQRFQVAQNVADAAAEDRDTPSEATL